MVSDRWPGLGGDVLAVDLDRSWLLLRDHGRPMAEAATAAEQVEVVAGLLPAYAAMQQAESAPVRLQRWLDAGLPDRRPAVLPDLLEDLLARRHDLALEPSLVNRCRAALDPFRRTCDRLERTPEAPPASVDHADLHGGNVLVDGTGRGRLIDWGDACCTHPFATLFVTFELVLRALPVAEREAAAAHLRDVYLAAWPTSDRAAQRHTFGLALRIAPIVRVLSLATEADGRDELVELLTAWSGPGQALTATS